MNAFDINYLPASEHPIIKAAKKRLKVKYFLCSRLNIGQYHYFLRNNFCTSPSNRIKPPFSPPSGPRSITQSDDFITSKLCSITITVFFFSTNL